MQCSRRGFTLVELVITLAVAAILLAVAVPGFFNMIQANRVASQANSLTSGFAYTRAEAVRRGTPVSICALAAPDTLRCGDNWQNGWMTFVNPDMLPGPAAATDVLRVGDALPPTVIVTSFSNDALGDEILHYQPLGDVALPAGGANNFAFRIRLRPDGCSVGTEHQRTIDVSRIGRAQVRQEECT